MAHSTLGRVALFSIRPRYAEAILDGRKTVEFRRKGLSADVSHVVIYVTAPVQKVLGFFEVASVDAARPRTLWRRYRSVGGVDRSSFDEYFARCESAFAIHVGKTTVLAEPLSLQQIHPDLRAPQSFQYLDELTAAKVMRTRASRPDRAGVRA